MKYSNDWAEGYTKICKSTTAIVYYYHSLHTAFEARPIYYSQANHPTGALDTTSQEVGVRRIGITRPQKLRTNTYTWKAIKCNHSCIGMSGTAARAPLSNE